MTRQLRGFDPRPSMVLHVTTDSAVAQQEADVPEEPARGFKGFGLNPTISGGLRRVGFLIPPMAVYLVRGASKCNRDALETLSVYTRPSHTHSLCFLNITVTPLSYCRYNTGCFLPNCLPPSKSFGHQLPFYISVRFLGQ